MDCYHWVINKLLVILAVLVLAVGGVAAATYVTELHPYQKVVTFTSKRNQVVTLTVKGTITDVDTIPDPETVTYTETVPTIAPTTTITYAAYEKAMATGGGILFYDEAAPYPYTTVELELIKSAGGRYARMDIIWSDVETSDNTYNWADTDRMFDAADAIGLKVHFIIQRTPAWARSGGTVQTYPTLASSYGDFTAAAVSRYHNRGNNGVHHWELWNEPNFSSFSADVTSTGAAKLAAMFNDAVPKMKAIDPTAKVYGGGILRGGATGHSTYRLDTEFLGYLYDGGLQIGLLDGMGYHPYTGSGGAGALDPADTSNTNVNHGWNRIDDMRAVLVARGDNIPLIITEWGQHTGSHVDAVSEAVQATYLQAAWDRYKAFVNSRDVTGPFFYYNHRNDGTDLANKEHNWGLTLSDRVTHKQARATFIGLK